MSLILINADSLHIPLADNSVQTCMTSPPYWGLRDYGTAKWEGGDPECDHNPQRPDGGDRADRTLPLGRGGMYRDVCGKCGAVRFDGQLGLEPTPEEYVANMVTVFRELWRVLRDDGTVWLNLGDSYARLPSRGVKFEGNNKLVQQQNVNQLCGPEIPPGLKEKDLVGIPWRVAFALQADGWYLRSDIIWHKPNPMPESVTDRPTKSHEYVFLLTKNARYYFDQDAVKEPFLESGIKRQSQGRNNSWGRIREADPRDKRVSGDDYPADALDLSKGRNIRTVWTIATQPTPFAHFATYPEKLVEPCIKAGTSERGRCPKCGKAWVRVTEKDSSNPWANRVAAGAKSGSKERGYNENHGAGMSHDLGSRSTTTGWQPTCSCNAGNPTPCIVLDPFAGSGTTGLVARRLGRHFVGLDLSRVYLHDIARRRLELDRLDAWSNGIQTNDDGWRDLPMFQEVQP